MDNYFAVSSGLLNFMYQPIVIAIPQICKNLSVEKEVVKNKVHDLYRNCFQESRKEVDQLIAKERYTTVGSLEEGIEKMAKEKYVFLWTKETMDVLLAGNCTFATLKGNDKFQLFTFNI